jgi:hypothetical protein
VDRLEKRYRISGTAMIAQQPGKARGGAQFPVQDALLACPVERLPEVILGRRRGSWCALQQKKLASQSQQPGGSPAFVGTLGASGIHQ